MALRGSLALSTEGPPLVAASELLALVAAALLDAGGASGGDTAAPPDANAQQNVSDAVAALPKLATARRGRGAPLLRAQAC